MQIVRIRSPGVKKTLENTEVVASELSAVALLVVAKIRIRSGVLISLLRIMRPYTAREQ